MNRKNAIRLAVGGGAILVVGLATYFGIKLATQPEKQNGGKLYIACTPVSKGKVCYK